MSMGANQEEQVLTMKDLLANYLAIARRGVRYWKRGAALFVVLLTAGTYWVATRPRVYKSEATFQWIYQATPGEPSPEGEQLQRQLEQKTNQVYTSRTNLLQVIEELNLYPTKRQGANHLSNQKLVDEIFMGAFAKRVDNDLVHLSFSYANAELAQNTVSRLIRLFREARSAAALDNARNQLHAAEEQLTRLQVELTAREQAYERFVTANQDLIDRLRQQEMAAPGGAVQAPVVPSGPPASAQTRSLRGRVASMESQIRQLQNPNSPSPSRPDEPESLQTARTRMNEARRNVETLRGRGILPDHPQMQGAVRDLQTAETNYNIEQSRYRSSAPSVPAGLSPEEARVRINALQEELRSVRRQLAESEAADRGAPPPPANVPLQQPLPTEPRLTNINEVRAGRDRLAAELTTTRNQVEDVRRLVLNRQAEVRRIEVQGGEQIRIIDQPTRPLDPEPPGKAKLGGIVFLVVLLLSLGTSLISGFIDTRVYDLADLQRWGEIPELPYIPELHADMPLGARPGGAGPPGARAG